jgi:sec-independent protein translocase protein TatA
MTLTNPVHLIFIVAIALIFLGPKRLPEMARSLGSGMREFREQLGGHHDSQEAQIREGQLATARADEPAAATVSLAVPAPLLGSVEREEQVS